MVVRRKRTKSKKKRAPHKRRTLKEKKKRSARYRENLVGALRVFAGACVLGAMVVGLVCLNDYVRANSSIADVVEIVDPPSWLNQPLKDRIYEVAAGGRRLSLSEDAARQVQQNIEESFAWLDEPGAQITHESICIEGRWRKPIALIKWGGESYLVDAELMVLDFVPMSKLPIVRIDGAALIASPTAGGVLQQGDVAAAVAVLSRLDKMDEIDVPDKPLLYEIDSIDVTNFRGRENRRAPHIILYAKDRTEIIWGAEIDAWSQHLEAPDEEKLAKLYGYYRQRGSLIAEAKYINLCDPQDRIPLPTDRY